MELKISELAREKVSKAILVSGSARSGTSILGKVLHSMKNVEYAFEPPMLFSLIALIKEIPELQWKLLFETYLYEEFMVNAVLGRAINCNREDDSSIFNVKSAEEIDKRLSRSSSKVDAEQMAQKHFLSYKLPDIVPFVPHLQQYYPAQKVIVVKREAVGTLNSLLVKKWFADENKDKNMIWPFRLHRGFQIPYWVDEADDDVWVEMNEIDRCAYYYIRVNENVDKIKNRIEVDYQRLLNEPNEIVADLAEQLGMQFGDKTNEIIDQIQPTVKERDSSVVEKLSPDLQKKVRFYSKQCVG